MGPFFHDEPHPEKSLLFLYLNTGKKSITLNLKTQTGKKIFRELVMDTDILVENFEPRVMPRLGLDYETLQEINPGLIMTSISNFGQTGPYRDFKSSEVVAQSLGGLTYMTGDADKPPLKLGGNQAQYQAGLNGGMATLTALWYREDTGLGQHVDISIMECIGSIMEQLDAQWEYCREIAVREGQRWIGRACWGPYECKDGWVTMCLVRRRMRPLADIVGEPVLKNPEYHMNTSLYADEIDTLLKPALKNIAKDDFYRKGQEAGMPVGIVATPKDILESPQLQARDYFVEIDHPVVGKLRYPGAPVIANQTPWTSGRAPLLGEHNEEIYCHCLGYSRQDLVRLRECGVI
jgi:CoA:oxalate CoA-transferase